MSDQEDKEIWAAYSKGVKKLDGSDQEEEKPQEKALPSHAAVKVKEKDVSPTLPPPPAPVKPQPLDARIERNMSLGDVVVEAKIDLHGKTEQEAYEAFQRFIEKQSAKGKRMLLVVSGKSGMLQVNVPRWAQTSTFSPYIMAVRTASPLHGGDGAYYVLLNKRSR